jgi:hypothetical protein
MHNRSVLLHGGPFMFHLFAAGAQGIEGQVLKGLCKGFWTVIPFEPPAQAV